DAVQANQQKYSPQEPAAVPPPHQRRPQEQKACNEANRGLKNCGLPVHQAKLRSIASLHVIHRHKNQTDQGDPSLNLPLRTSSTIQGGQHQERDPSCLANEISEIQAARSAHQEGNFANGGKREAEPPGKPESEVSRVMIAKEKAEEHQ